MTKLPELCEQVMKAADEGPKQWDWIEWLQPGLSAPTLGTDGANADDDSPRQSDVIDWWNQLLTAPPLNERD